MHIRKRGFEVHKKSIRGGKEGHFHPCDIHALSHFNIPESKVIESHNKHKY